MSRAARRPVFGTYKSRGHEYWCARWYDGHGKRRREHFGRTDELKRKIAEAQFDDWFANDYRAKEYVRNPSGDIATYTVHNLCDDVKKDANARFIKNGRPTSHVSQINSAMDALDRMYGPRPADALGAPDIAKLRDAMIHSKDNNGNPRLLTRKKVNGRLVIVKDAYR